MSASLSPSVSKTGVLLAVAFGWLLGPTLAAADVYIWTDERGTTVISDTPPTSPKRVTNLETVVKDAPRKTAKSTGPHEPTPTERKLLERIDQLERQTRGGPTYTAPAPPPPAPAAYSGNYYTSPPPPAYSSAYSTAYYDPYDPYYSPYPSYGYPSYYPYGAVIAAPIIVRRGFVGARPFVHRGGFAHRGFAGRGRR